MRLLDTAAGMRDLSRQWRREGRAVALVPTMGALHEGHLSLARLAQSEADRVIVTIYVNPTQFAPGEDLAAYPRTLDQDCALLEDLHVDAVFAPAMDMYLPDHETWVAVDGLTQGLCGLSRPAHFRGVTTVVAKLFHITEPDIAVFGQKDYQQAKVIQRMARDLDFPINIRVGPIVREADGLAMSSRNRFLSPEDRAGALVLSRSLFACRERAEAGASLAELRALLDASLAARARGKLDYAVIAHPETLREASDLAAGAVIALAMRFDSARLIDNILIGPRNDG